MALPQATWFGSQNAPLLGHLHTPERGLLHGLPVVLCATHGQEYMSAHQTMHALAAQLASGGHPCLRFDHAGCGDSMDPPESAVLKGIAAWPQGIGEAIDHVKALTGASAVVLIGFRLGATMAALAAQGRTDVAALVAWAAPLKGRVFAREWSLWGLSTLARTGLPAPVGSDDLEAGGFVLTANDAQFLKTVDLLALSEPAAPRVLLVDPDQAPADAAWHNRLVSLGAQVDRIQPQGLGAMLRVPHFSVVPQPALNQIAKWVGQLPQPWGSPKALSLSGPAVVSVPTQGLHETAFWLDSASPLSAVLTQPLRGLIDKANLPQVGVLMINTGGEHRIGTNRMYTRWARTWAAQGWISLRIDLPGLGNSPAKDGEPACEIHQRQATQDILAAVTHMQTGHGLQQVHLIGLCSGAFHALSAAFEGVPIRSVTAINQMVYFWQDNMPLAGEGSAAVVVAITQNVGRNLSDPQRWLKLLRGEVHVRVILRALARRQKQRFELAFRSLARYVRWPLKHDLHTSLLQAAASGKHVHLIFSEGESGLTMVQEQAGQAVTRLIKHQQMTVTVMPQTDHTFTQQHAQQALFDVVDQGIRHTVGVSHSLPSRTHKNLGALQGQRT
ncbi:MAG: hypothetical protein Q7U28_04310 [Aquabacterium sp.]|nr:hypothetical protein [Aquabacterium sp.]